MKGLGEDGTDGLEVWPITLGSGGPKQSSEHHLCMHAVPLCAIPPTLREQKIPEIA